MKEKRELECTLSLAAEENWNHLQFLSELLGKESAGRTGGSMVSSVSPCTLPCSMAFTWSGDIFLTPRPVMTGYNEVHDIIPTI